MTFSPADSGRSGVSVTALLPAAKLIVPSTGPLQRPNAQKDSRGTTVAGLIARLNTTVMTVSGDAVRVRASGWTVMTSRETPAERGRGTVASAMSARRPTNLLELDMARILASGEGLVCESLRGRARLGDC